MGLIKLSHAALAYRIVLARKGEAGGEGKKKKKMRKREMLADRSTNAAQRQPGCPWLSPVRESEDAEPGARSPCASLPPPALPAPLLPPLCPKG